MSEYAGRIAQLWQYPVKSMGGQTLDAAELASDGLLGDRGWAVRDEDAGQLTVVRRDPKLLQCTARYRTSPAPGESPTVEITLPGGVTFDSDDPGCETALTEFLGKPVTLWPRQPKSNWKHYRLARPAGARELKRQFAMRELPDLSSISLPRIAELMMFVTPLGRYHDVYPLHILSSGALAKMREAEPEGDFRPERFRPNLCIESPDGVVDFDDFAWVGGRLTIGDVVIQCESRTVRCLAPAQPQADLPKDARVLRAIEKHTARHLGINATVLRAGRVEVGQEVYFEPGARAPRETLSTYDRWRNRMLHSAMELTDRLNGDR